MKQHHSVRQEHHVWNLGWNSFISHTSFDSVLSSKDAELESPQMRAVIHTKNQSSINEVTYEENKF